MVLSSQLAGLLVQDQQIEVLLQSLSQELGVFSTCEQGAQTLDSFFSLFRQVVGRHQVVMEVLGAFALELLGIS